MGLRINQNIAALNAHRNLVATDNALSKSLERLSSGFRINRAADDAAGLAISERLRAQVRGYAQAVRNAQDGISLVQTAEGALNEVHSILQRMRELVVQAGTGTVSSDDRDAIQTEIEALIGELNRISDATTFNGVQLLNGSAGTVSILVDANGSNVIVVNLSRDLDAAGLGVDGVDVTAGSFNAATTLSTIDGALATVSTTRAQLGAVQNRLEHTIANLGVAVENLSAAESRIRDADMAQEMVQFTRNQILLQAGTAMVAQANAAPQVVLQLLR